MYNFYSYVNPHNEMQMKIIQTFVDFEISLHDICIGKRKAIKKDKTERN